MLKKLFKFGKNKEDVIEIWTRHEGLPKVVPVKSSSHFMPKWWINTPKWQNEKVQEQNTKNNIHNKGTVKRCPAIPEFMSMGFVVPLWCDLKVDIFEDGSFKWYTPTNQFTFGSHGSSQLGDHIPKHSKPSLILKPDCPWKVKTPKNISLLHIPMLWHFNPTFTVAPGVIWTDIHHEINQQMMFHRYGSFKIERGTPLAQYIPIRRDKFDMNVGDETPELRKDAQASYLHVRTKFGSGYPNHQTKVKKQKEGKCPYHAT